MENLVHSQIDFTSDKVACDYEGKEKYYTMNKKLVTCEKCKQLMKR